jgi:glycosyltransferase involved in cell wall biosynthesis
MGTGGVGNQIWNLSTRLAELGYEVKIRSLSPLGRFGRKAAASGLDVESLNINNKLAMPVALYRIRKLIQNYSPDIVHTHLFHATILGRIAAIGTGASTISTVHNTYDRNPERRTKTARDRLYALTDRYCELTTFVSDAARDRYIEVDSVSADKSCRVYNGVDTEEFRPVERASTREGPFVWITVGNLQEQKDHRTLLEAVHSVKASHNQKFELWIIGE